MTPDTSPGPGRYTIICADALEAMRAMEADSVDAVVTDPPYYRVKDADWDNVWDGHDAFFEWFGALCREWRRVLRLNGSLWVFCQTRLQARVEAAVAQHFNVLNNVVWQKINCAGKRSCKEGLRAFFPHGERIIFAEQRYADSPSRLQSDGDATPYHIACDRLRGRIFEPLRAYLAGECERAGHTARTLDAIWQAERGTKGCMAGHWLDDSQWALPTAEGYAWLRRILNATGGDYLRREYEDLRREYEDLRREYEDLRREYEDLRRPFNVTRDDQWSDVWTFDTVGTYQGKHPCEKPLPLMEHIVNTSTRPGAVVLDCFIGSGATGIACVRQGRQIIGIDNDPHWAAVAEERIAGEAGDWTRDKAARFQSEQQSLF